MFRVVREATFSDDEDEEWEPEDEDDEKLCSRWRYTSTMACCSPNLVAKFVNSVH